MHVSAILDMRTQVCFCMCVCVSVVEIDYLCKCLTFSINYLTSFHPVMIETSCVFFYQLTETRPLEDLQQQQQRKWIAYVTRTENNQGVDFPHHFKQNVRKETSLNTKKKARTTTALEKLILLKNCLHRNVSNIFTDISTGCSVKECRMFPYKETAIITI